MRRGTDGFGFERFQEIGGGIIAAPPPYRCRTGEGHAVMSKRIMAWIVLLGLDGPVVCRPGALACLAEEPKAERSGDDAAAEGPGPAAYIYSTDQAIRFFEDR